MFEFPAAWSVRLSLVTVITCSGIVTADDLLVSGRFNDTVIKYDAETGEFRSVFAEGDGLDNAIGMDFGPDGHLYVATGDAPSVLKFDGNSGAFLEAFVVNDPDTPTDETGGLAGPRGLIFGPDGDLYVSSGISDQVLAYDGQSGAFVRVAAEGGGLNGPIGLDFGPDGNLYVAGGLSNAVHKYDGRTGLSMGVFANATQLVNATGLLFGPDGALYVASGTNSLVMRFDGATGDSMGVFASGNGLVTPIGIEFGPDGHLYVGSFQTDSVLRFDGATGDFIDLFVTNGAGGLDGTHFLLFRSTCLADVTGNGTVDATDILAITLTWGPCGASCPGDLDGDGVVGVEDLLLVLLTWECP
ncbi:MAG: SMP-30/gluconolactonase/LRE family protein [Planctomycetota bacterium]|jgi:WD40 repeat protein